MVVQYLEPHYCERCRAYARFRMRFTEMTLDGLAGMLPGDPEHWQHDTASHRSRYWHQD